MSTLSLRLAFASVVLLSGPLAGCSSKDGELEEFLRQTRQEQPGGVQPLPEVQPYESFVYQAQGLRSPFVPGGSGSSSTAGLRPDSHRKRETLEQHSLDSMKMVGTLNMGGHAFALVQTKDGLVHRVLPGNFIGQNDGKIESIAPSKISITEIVPDGLGGYMERPAALTLSE
jgi:type IV pilus assembly protein PilP